MTMPSRHPRPRTWRVWSGSARARSFPTRIGFRRATPRPRSPRCKDGTTHLAYKPEHAVDLDTGAVVAAELHPADEGDTTTLSKTLAKAEANLEAVDAAPTSEDPAECVADKGYHSRAVLRALNDSPWKTRIAAPKQTGFSRWHGDEAARRAVTNNRARLKSGVAREAFKLRAEIVERCFAHNLDRGGMRRTWLSGREQCAQAIPAPRRRPQSIVTDAPAHRRRHPAGGRGGRIWRYFRSAHAHRGHAGGTGGLAKRPEGFRRRIPHLGVRAGKSHLINGVIRPARPNNFVGPQIRAKSSSPSNADTKRKIRSTRSLRRRKIRASKLISDGLWVDWRQWAV